MPSAPPDVAGVKRSKVTLPDHSATESPCMTCRIDLWLNVPTMYVDRARLDRLGPVFSPTPAVEVNLTVTFDLVSRCGDLMTVYWRRRRGVLRGAGREVGVDRGSRRVHLAAVARPPSGSRLRVDAELLFVAFFQFERVALRDEDRLRRSRACGRRCSSGARPLLVGE